MQDLRDYIEQLERREQLLRITAEVDWNQELGAITRLACERRAPAPLFENIKGYPGHRVLGVAMGPDSRSLFGRVATALERPIDTHPLDLIESIRTKLSKPVEPVVVDRDSAPCKEIIHQGDDANLLDLPVPWIKSIDGGRYVGTSCIVVTKDPDTGWTNWGTYRCMVHDERSFGILLLPSEQHGGGILERYKSAGKPMPIAVVIGADPHSSLAAMTPFEKGVSESAMAGALKGSPVSLVECETSDLLVPATAEFVIEAEVHPGDLAMEGPFGEYTGHAAHSGLSPVARVSCITHRANPIFTMANPSKPYDDNGTPMSLMVSALIKSRLEAAGVPGVSVFLPSPPIVTVVSAKARPGLAKRVFASVFSGYRMFSSGLVLVDDDVDITDMDQVWWAIATRLHPDRFEVVRRLPVTNPLLPHLTPEERSTWENSAWIMDATFPTSWSSEYRHKHTRVVDFADGWTEDIQRLVLGRWAEYGYGQR
ncbi:UbiD family decarboxylase [Nocardia sp. NBC_01730]|uniref:UbiD family decarboxylase n=1 Tax=Nocardia sp. NBC_01730 TaxID=2975998 RepID=UPI002E119152|nr:UbiD family decarboxylase [Nocardia sp. NBC_01730]